MRKPKPLTGIAFSSLGARSHVGGLSTHTNTRSDWRGTRTSDQVHARFDEVDASENASDLFVTVGFPPAMKIDGKVTPVSKQDLTPQNCKALTYAIMNDRQLKS